MFGKKKKEIKEAQETPLDILEGKVKIIKKNKIDLILDDLEFQGLILPEK